MWYYVEDNYLRGATLNKKYTILINTLKNACVMFTIVILALYSAGKAFSTDELKWIPTFTMVWMVLVFSLSVNLAGLLLRLERFNLVIRIILHYATVAVVFYFVFLLWGGFGSEGNLVIGLMFVYTVVYAVAAAVILVMKKPWKKNEQKASEYKSMLK
jgi:hypothetical protein